ncbi:MAG TPA: TonB-dependent receptor [Rhodanobacteraceae bacterium]
MKNMDFKLNAIHVAVLLALPLGGMSVANAYVTPQPARAAAQTATPPTGSAAAGAAVKKGKKTSQKAGSKQAQKLNVEKLKAINVVGFRASVLNAVTQQELSNNIVNVINSESVSQFPDTNVADSLSRLPGVIITRNGGEGKNVSVRGLPPGLTLTELNGNFVANAQAEAGGLTRSFNYLLLPPTFISSVDVYKSEQAKLDAGGIGGTIILHTRTPLEMPSNKGFVQIGGTDLDTMDKFEPQISALYSWHSKNGKFGALVGIDYEKRDVKDYLASATSWHWWANGESASNYAAQPPLLANGKPVSDPSNVDFWPNGGVTDQSGRSYSGYWMPQQVPFDQRTERRRHEASQVTLEFRPSRNFTLTGNYFRFKFNNNNVNNTLEIPEWGLPTGPFSEQQGEQLAPNGLTFGGAPHTIVTGAKYIQPDGTGCAALVNPVTGAARTPSSVCSQQYPWVTGNYDIQSATSQSANIKGDWSADDDLISGSFNIGRTWSNGGPTVSFSAAAKPRVFKDGHYINGNQLAMWNISGRPSMQVSPDVLQNMLNGIGQMDLGSTGAGTGLTKMAQNYFQADFTLMPDIDWISSINFGFKYTNTHGSQTSLQQQWDCPGTTTEYQNCSPTAGVLMPQFLLPYSLPTNTRAFTTNVYPAFNFSNYYAYLNHTYGPLQNINQAQNFGGIREQDNSAYLQLNYDKGPLRGNVGVRWMRVLQSTNIGTEVETLNQEYYQTTPGPGGTILMCPSTGVNVVGAPCNPGDFQYRPQSDWDVFSTSLQHNYRAYNRLLPSVNVVYSLPDHFQLRGAWSKAMSPPGYGDLLQTGSVTHVTPAYYYDRAQFGAQLPGFYGSGGNPNLKEFTATQYDLMAAWYPKPGAVVSVDYFHKNVKNFVVPVTLSNFPVDVGGVPTVMTQFSTIGSGGSGTSKGLEFSGQYLFHNGFGVLANYTLNKTNNTDVFVDGQVVGTSKLVGSAKYAANFSVFYQNPKFLVRVSSNWTGPVIDGLVTGLTEYQQSYKEIDINANYKVTHHLSLHGAILNVGRALSRSRIGDDTFLRLSQLEYSGREYLLTATYSFGGAQ